MHYCEYKISIIIAVRMYVLGMSIPGLFAYNSRFSEFEISYEAYERYLKGLDNIAPELLKTNYETSARLISPLIEDFWDKGELHAELKEGAIINLPKKGDLSECKNWRGITLLSMVNKIIAQIFNIRISSALKTHLRTEQAGFRAGRSCVDHVNSLRVIVEQSVEWRSPLYLIFIDFQKAFDTLYHHAIWNALACKGVPKLLIELILALYTNASCRILHKKELSGRLPVTTGVRQGCILSPLLFNIVLDVVMRKATRETKGITWGLNGRLEDLDYADDICLMAHTFADMSKKLTLVAQTAAEVGLKINVAKTKVMRVNTNYTQKFQISNAELEDVDSFCYLGSILSANGGSREDIENRIKKAKQAFGALNAVWNSTIITRRTKIKIFNSNVKSALMYGCETWNLAASDLQTLQVFTNRCLRKILRIFWPDTISNNDLWNRCNQTPMRLEILKRKWGWLGHVLRRDQTDITRNAIDWNPQGSRRKGRPALTWRRNLEADVLKTNKTWSEIKRLAHDRGKWRNLVAALCSLAEP